MTEKYLITDARKQGKTEIALAYRENRKGKKEHERISPYWLIFDENGEPNFEYGKDTKLKLAEAEGMRSLWELANENKEFLIWVSPSGGDEDYPEGRLVIGWVKERGKRTVIECRGIPILESGQNLFQMTNDLINKGAVTMDEIRDTEDLRKEALGVNCKTWEEFLNLCENTFGNHEVWKKIRSGDDVVETKKTENVVVEVMQELGARGWTNNPYRLERMMAVRGFVLMAGNHGVPNSNNQNDGAFDKLYNNSVPENLDSRLEECKQCHKAFMKKKGKCPKCYPEN